MANSSSTTRPERVTAFGAALLVALLPGCDGGPPLSECDPGLFDADCGGTTPPVVACERNTGECRWFRTSTVAANHAVSRCAAEDICCERVEAPVPLDWPFEDWRPATEAARLRAVRDLGILRYLRVEREQPTSEIAATFDAGLPLLDAPVLECPTPTPGCRPGPADGLTVPRYRAGRSLVLVVGTFLGRGEHIIEVSPSRVSDGLVARAFWVTFALADSPTYSSVGCTAHGDSLDVVGSIRLSPDAFDDPAAARGVVNLTFAEGGTELLLRF